MRALFLPLLVAAAACGEATFSAHARDNHVPDIHRALAASRPSERRGPAVAYLVSAEPDKKLAALDLTTGKLLWETEADVRSRLVAGGGLVVGKEGADRLVARDGTSGQPVFSVRLDASEVLLGAAADDERVYYVVQATGQRRVSSVVAVDRGGRELWRKPAQGSLGAPAARGGVVAVPFHHQNVSLLEGKSGKELARVRATDDQITFVRAVPDGFVYGGARGVYLLDEKSAQGTRQASSFAEANLGSEQVRTFYYWNGYETAQADYSAFDRNRLLWRARPGEGGLGFEDDRVFLHSYRYFFAFDGKAGRLRWAYAHPRVDLVTADAAGPSVVFASVDGEVGALDAAGGAVTVLHKTGRRLRGVTFDAEGFRGPGQTGRGDPVKTLETIIWDPDSRFTAVKVFAVDALGDVPGKDAAAALLKVVLAKKGMAPAVQKKAGEELVKRKDAEAAPLYLEALKLRFDFLEDKEPHGVDVLARAVAALGVKPAAPLLADHLLDAATPQHALREVAAALAALGGKEAVAALREFLLTYRADPIFVADPSPLNIAAEGLLRHGGAAERRTVKFVAEDARTLSPVGAYLKKALTDGAAVTAAPPAK